MEHNKEHYLADWMADKLSDEQLKQLVSAEDFVVYQKLRKSLENYTLAPPKMEESFQSIQQKIAHKNATPKTKVVHLWKYAAVAASVALLFGLYQTFYFANTIDSGFGATQTVVLQDRSVVTLNAKSTLKYPNQFKWNRTLQLDGEAFFEVEKGSTFTVKTNFGTVEVLGTKFNVFTDNDFFEVQCYEGKVRVKINNEITDLTQNKSVRFSAGQLDLKEIQVETSPTWMHQESSFVNVPFDVVINNFNKQFKKKVSYPEHLKKIKFTGNFSNTNIETALKSITIPLQLKYVTQNNTIILSE
jgi:ferric-dicitrate binding protein FerR (iron transport regulator)